MGEADALQTAYAQPIVRLILQKNIDDMYATQQALVLCDPSHTALIGALQARVMWHQMLPTWLRETIDAARDRQDAEEQIADPAERYIDE